MEARYKQRVRVGDTIARIVIFGMAIGGLLFMLFGPPLPTMADDLHALRGIILPQ